MAHPKPTFNQILKDIERSNSEKLMKRARRANRLAKRLRGQKKQLAYGVKHKALSFLIRKLPDRIEIRKDIILTDFVVVGLKNAQSGLHLPSAVIESG
jgi:ribulose 1,5-bisphosphate carboxylase large subunit-like protein